MWERTAGTSVPLRPDHSHAPSTASVKEQSGPRPPVPVELESRRVVGALAAVGAVESLA